MKAKYLSPDPNLTSEYLMETPEGQKLSRTAFMTQAKLRFAKNKVAQQEVLFEFAKQTGLSYHVVTNSIQSLVFRD